MKADGVGLRPDNGVQRLTGSLQKGFRFAGGNQPRIHVARTPGIDSFENVEHRFVLVQTYGQPGVERGEAMGHRPRSIFRKNDAKPCYRSARVRLTCAAQPEQCKRKAVVRGI